MEGFRIQPKAADAADRSDYNRERGYGVDFYSLGITDYGNRIGRELSNEFNFWLILLFLR